MTVLVAGIGNVLSEPQLKKVQIVGCEPMPFDPEDETGFVGLSEPAALVVDEAVRLVQSVIAGLLAVEPV